MCREKANGGRRCPSHTPEHRRMMRTVKAAQQKYKGPKDTPCPEMACGEGVIRWIDLNDVFHQELCKTCGGVGYLNDGTGRARRSTS